MTSSEKIKYGLDALKHELIRSHGAADGEYFWDF